MRKQLLLSVKDNEVSDQILLDLWNVQVVQIRYLQEEYSSVLVQGQFNPEVARLFRTLQKNTSGFTPRALDILEKATTISAANTRSNTNNISFRGRGNRFNSNLGGHGFGNRGRRNFGGVEPRDISYRPGNQQSQGHN